MKLEKKKGRIERQIEIWFLILLASLRSRLSRRHERPGGGGESGPAVVQGACENGLRGHRRCVVVISALSYMYVRVCLIVQKGGDGDTQQQQLGG